MTALNELLALRRKLWTDLPIEQIQQIGAKAQRLLKELHAANIPIPMATPKPGPKSKAKAATA